jgi:protein TonB
MTQTALPNHWHPNEDDAFVQTRERRRFSRAMILSGLFHVVLLLVLLGLWNPATKEEPIPLPPIPITIVEEQEGQSGAQGGGSGITSASSESSPPQAESSDPTVTETAPERQTTQAPQPQQPQSQPFLRSTVTETPSLSAPEALDATEPVPPHKPVPPQATLAPPQATTQAHVTPSKPQVQQPATSAQNQAPSNSSPSDSVDALLREGVGGRGRGDEGAGRAAVGNGSAEGPGDDYLKAVQRWIARYEKYPPEALAKKQEGVTMLGFIIDRQGNVLDAWIDKSSGNPLLDTATLEMIHAASPIPKVPDRYKGEKLKLVMPANYSIGIFDRLFH